MVAGLIQLVGMHQGLSQQDYQWVPLLSLTGKMGLAQLANEKANVRGT